MHLNYIKNKVYKCKNNEHKNTRRIKIVNLGIRNKTQKPRPPSTLPHLSLPPSPSSSPTFTTPPWSPRPPSHFHPHPAHHQPSNTANRPTTPHSKSSFNCLSRVILSCTQIDMEEEKEVREWEKRREKNRGLEEMGEGGQTSHLAGEHKHSQHHVCRCR